MMGEEESRALPCLIMHQDLDPSSSRSTQGQVVATEKVPCNSEGRKEDMC